MERKRWIDWLRGAAMMLILLFHTEVYYKQENVTPYYIYVTNSILCFYFISGYLFYRQGPLCIKHKLESIVRSMLMPYLIFTSIIFPLKYMFYGYDLDVKEIAVTILSGQASWFIAALITSELLFAMFLYICKGKTSFLFALSLLCLVVHVVVPFHQYHNVWQWQDALLAVPFLYVGYVYHRHEDVADRFLRPWYSLLLFIALVLVKVYEYNADYPMNNIAIVNYPLFFIDAALSIVVIIGLKRLIPSSKMIEWTGRHSIVYYFLCGGVPVLTSLLLSKAHFSYSGHLWQLALAFVLCYLLSTILTWLIYHYIPFITGRRP